MGHAECSYCMDNPAMDLFLLAYKVSLKNHQQTVGELVGVRPTPAALFLRITL